MTDISETKNSISEELLSIEFNTIHQRLVNKLRHLPVEKLIAIEVLIDQKPEKNHIRNKNQKPSSKNKQLK